eukprot:CAMPEP_0172723178 /NCGR_PEP_ID=MMETSP1074-20121228/83169_1 /TAXON_ID=2916 /ORGANISM="Ceratium fusus, Strain PA161109" /LENGTH=198 /DNA_ID=CAMNT_0013549377 /DNA_START=144 /DNA_END=740 /DNA_ORIENTATION=-
MPRIFAAVSIKPEIQRPTTSLMVFPTAAEHIVVTPNAMPSFESKKSPAKIMMALSKKPKPIKGMMWWRAYMRICLTVGSGISNASALSFPNLTASSCAAAGVAESRVASALSFNMSCASCVSTSLSIRATVAEAVVLLVEAACDSKFNDRLSCGVHGVVDSTGLRQPKLLQVEGQELTALVPDALSAKGLDNNLQRKL